LCCKVYKKFLVNLTILTGLFWLLSCGGNVEDPDAPVRPQWVPKSAPDDSLESGIDADPNGNVIMLEWYNGTEDDLAGYRIYRASGEDAKDFQLLTEINALAIPGAIMTYIDEAVDLRTEYAYFLRAYDQAGNFSVRSDTIHYQLIEKVDLMEPLGSVNTTRPVFKWSDLRSPATEYVIRVEQIGASHVCWLCRLVRQNYVGEIQSKTYASDGQVYQSELVSGQVYRWRVDCIYNFDRNGVEIAGSESNWGYFTIQ